MKKRRKGPPEPVGSLVERVHAKVGGTDTAYLRVFTAWEKVVSDRVYDNARPARLQQGKLVVHTATSAWASALQLDTENILEGLRARVPRVPVTSLVFRVGALPPAPPRAPKRRPPPVLRPVTDLPEDVARALARIGNDDLRDAVARAAAAGLAKPERDTGGR